LAFFFKKHLCSIFHAEKTARFNEISLLSKYLFARFKMIWIGIAYAYAALVGFAIAVANYGKISRAIFVSVCGLIWSAVQETSNAAMRPETVRGTRTWIRKPL